MFPDDAADIKRHQFFRGVDWEHLHQMKPPEVPKVKDNLDTKYFDQEPSVSDMGSSRSTSIMSEEDFVKQEELERQIVAVYEENARLQRQLQGGGYDGQQGGEFGTSAGNKELNEEAFIAAAYDVLKEEGEGKIKAREKKRPRDRILRDKGVGKEALELRKKGAFLGYTYRRPQNILMEAEPNREKSETRFRKSGLPSLASLSLFRGNSQG